MRAVVMMSVAIVFTAAGPPPRPVAALQVRDVSVDGSPTCSECGIRLTRSLSIGEADGDAALHESPSVALAPDGRLWVVSPFREQVIRVFERDGSFYGTFGRRGEGPGEFSAIFALVGTRDGVTIIDTGNHRVSTITQQFDVVYEARLRGETFAVAQADAQRLVVNSVIPTRAQAGLPLHLLGDDGTHLKSFGGGSDAFRPDSPGTERRVLAPAREDGVWSAHSTQYVLTRWSPDGRALDRIRRQRDWFTPHLGDYVPNPETPPPAYVSAVREDDDGLLWVASVVPDNNWAEGLRSSVGRSGRTLYGVDELNRYFDTIVEVIDPAAGTVMATSERVDQALLGFLADGRAFSRRKTEIGIPILDIWRLELIDPRGRRQERP